MLQERDTWVIGHKNPDTDSICSAIAYAYLKNQKCSGNYIPKKAGDINGETAYVLEKFGVKEPETVYDVGTQISDVDLRYNEGVRTTDTLLTAWQTMRRENVVTLPVIDEKDRLEGLITSDDIARSHMSMYGTDILSTSRTSYHNIVETLQGKVWTGNEHAFFHKGKVKVATGDDLAVKNDVEEDDLIILGNVKHRQMIVLEKNPSCLIICPAKEVDPEIIAVAKSKQIVVISTEFDAFTTARLLHQSMPVRQFMTKEKDIIRFGMDETIDDVADKMSKIRHRDFPIVDSQRRYVAMFSRRMLLLAEKKRVILVDHNEKSQAVDGVDEADILEIIDHHRIGTLETITPIFFRNQPLGCSSTIIYQMYQEQGVEIPKHIAGLMCSAILSDTLMFKSPTCTAVDEAACRALAEIAGIDIREHALAMFEAGSDFGDKTPTEIIYTDFKTFNADEVVFGVSQVSSVSENQLNHIKPALQECLNKALIDKSLDMGFVLLTNILEQSSEILYAGNNARFTVADAFGDDKMTADSGILPGVVSRKKQVVPNIIESLQRQNA